MAYQDLFVEVDDAVYRLVPLSECINTIMFCGGKRITFAYTALYHKPEGDKWVGREHVDEDGKRGMVWKQEVADTKKNGSAA